MTVYLSSPGSQLHADHLRGMPVLVSYAGDAKKAWMERYLPSFSRLLIDSGAYSELTGKAKVDLDAYAEWSHGFAWADAVAALDDIRGDWQRGMGNWRAHPWQFPTFHDSDPWEALETILAFEPKWLGLGMVPPRTNEKWLRETLERIPAGVHVHGWALRAYSHHSRIDSFDSTEWFRSAQKLEHTLHWLTHGERLEIIVKRYQREGRRVLTDTASAQGNLDL